MFKSISKYIMSLIKKSDKKITVKINGHEGICIDSNILTMLINNETLLNEPELFTTTFNTNINDVIFSMFYGANINIDSLGVESVISLYQFIDKYIDYDVEHLELSNYIMLLKLLTYYTALIFIRNHSYIVVHRYFGKYIPSSYNYKVTNETCTGCILFGVQDNILNLPRLLFETLRDNHYDGVPTKKELDEMFTFIDHNKLFFLNK